MPGQGKRLDWTYEEIVLACDLVMQNSRRGLPAEHPQVVELSELLRNASVYPLDERLPSFRNANGVGRKTADIATSLPDYGGIATHGSSIDKKVIDDFEARPDVMHELAQKIRVELATDIPPGNPVDAGDDDDDGAVLEGKYLYRMHASRERKPGLRKKKIASVLAKGGSLVCEVCGIDFGQYYGKRGDGYIECHHVEPLHVTGQRIVKVRDLALLCSNCHRMIHRQPPWPTPAELRTIVEAQKRS
jgi:5-methylcytosine-specific restriction enzyme A